LDWFALSFVLGVMHSYAIVSISRALSHIPKSKEKSDLEVAVSCFYILTAARIA